MINSQCCGFFEGKKGLRRDDPIPSLLFVISMDYLTRTLKVVGEKLSLNFTLKLSLKNSFMLY